MMVDHSQRVKNLAETFTSHGLETIAEDNIKKKKVDETVRINSHRTTFCNF